MPLDGNGTYQPPAPEFPAIPNTTILSADFNAIILDLAAALSNAIYRDGQAPFVTNQSMGNFKLTDLADGSADGDATNYKQVFFNPTFTADGNAPEGVRIVGTQATIKTQNLTATGVAWDLNAVAQTYLGEASGVTKPSSDNSNALATTAFVTQVAFNSALPAQAGNAGKFVQTDGTNARWVSLKGPLYFMGQF